MQNCRLDNLLSSQTNNTILVEALKLIKHRATLGSLSSYDDFDFAELVRFRKIYRLEVEITITGAELFPGEMMTPRKNDVRLPDDIYNLLVEYYNAAYEDLSFFSIAEAAQNPERSNRRIVILPQINQFGRIQIEAEIFGSVNALRYFKNSFILAKFVQEMDQLIYSRVKSSTFSNTKLICRMRGEFIDWLTSDGSNRPQTISQGFTFKLTTMNKAVLWNYGPKNSKILVENVLYRFITYMVDLYLAVTK